MLNSLNATMSYFLIYSVGTKHVVFLISDFLFMQML